MIFFSYSCSKYIPKAAEIITIKYPNLNPFHAKLRSLRKRKINHDIFSGDI
jgi:hypothetical protein